MSSPYRRDPSNGCIGELNERARAWALRKRNVDESVRPGSYIRVTSENGYSLPKDEKTFGEVYDRFKPKPILKNVTVTQGGNYGLTMEMEAEIQCHDKESFAEIEREFLTVGTEISIEFGYGIPRPGYTQNIKMVNFMVCGYEFNTTDAGYWIAKFKAVSAAEAILSLDVVTSPISNASTKTFKIDGEDFKVQGLPDVLLYHAQNNGSQALDDAPESGVVYLVDDELSKGHVLVVDIEPLKRTGNPTTVLGSLARGIKGAISFALDSYKAYYNLEYVVNLFNRSLKGTYATSMSENPRALDKFVQLEIKFDDVLSVSWIPVPIRSAYPEDVLILGEGGGNYTRGSAGKNFDKIDGADATYAIEEIVPDGNIGFSKVMHSKILVSLDLVLSALDAEKPEKRESESNNGRSIEESNVKLNNFFDKISKAINRATGGAIALRLSQHPDIHEQPAKSDQYTLYVVDENNGKKDRMDCIVLNPIDGDGTTKTASLSSGAGGQEYQGSMMATAKSGEAPRKAKGEKTSNKKSKYDEALEGYPELQIKLIQTGFGGEACKSLQEFNNTIRQGPDDKINKYSMFPYPGMSLDIEIEGLYGITPMCGLMTTHFPGSYRDNNIYFYVKSVTHKFDAGDSSWTTSYETQMAYHNNVNYITFPSLSDAEARELGIELGGDGTQPPQLPSTIAAPSDDGAIETSLPTVFGNSIISNSGGGNSFGGGISNG